MASTIVFANIDNEDGVGKDNTDIVVGDDGKSDGDVIRGEESGGVVDVAAMEFAEAIKSFCTKSEKVELKGIEEYVVIDGRRFKERPLGKLVEV